MDDVAAASPSPLSPLTPAPAGGIALWVEDSDLSGMTLHDGMCQDERLQLRSKQLTLS